MPTLLGESAHSDSGTTCSCLGDGFSPSQRRECRRGEGGRGLAELAELPQVGPPDQRARESDEEARVCLCLCWCEAESGFAQGCTPTSESTQGSAEKSRK